MIKRVLVAAALVLGMSQAAEAGVAGLLYAGLLNTTTGEEADLCMEFEEDGHLHFTRQFHDDPQPVTIDGSYTEVDLGIFGTVNAQVGARRVTGFRVLWYMFVTVHGRSGTPLATSTTDVHEECDSHTHPTSADAPVVSNSVDRVYQYGSRDRLFPFTR
jgi:hypothetical protein